MVDEESVPSAGGNIGSKALRGGEVGLGIVEQRGTLHGSRRLEAVSTAEDAVTCISISK